VLSNSSTLRRAARALALTTVGVLALAACGSSGPSISTPGGRVGQAATSTTSSTTTPTSTSTTTSTSTAAPTTTTVPAGQQVVTDGGLRFNVPAAWPVYTLASDPNRCIRLDQHAVYLGQEGPAPKCPAVAVGRTETVQVQALNATSQTANSIATQAETVNGLNVRVDPSAGISRAFTVVFPDQGLVATITFSGSPVLANQILQSFQHAS
jgi:hypothetical protein